MIRKILIVFTCLFELSLNAFACDCGKFNPLSKELFNNNKKLIVFKGKVLNVSNCEKIATCNFDIDELFFGNSTKVITAFYDCQSDCSMNFNPGEEWIIYGEYVQLEKIKIEFCSRSRRINNDKNAYFENVTYGMSTSDELTWLRSNIGVKNIRQDIMQRDAGHRNEQPDTNTKIILLITSISVMVLFLIFSKRLFK
jgi:hypothetical protein